MSDDRRIDLLTAKIDDLLEWLKSTHAEQHKDIKDALLTARRELADHASQIADLKIDVHDHGKRLRALEERKAIRGKK